MSCAFISVKGPGAWGPPFATGNGTTDDTAAIQAAFDFAFKTGGVPNGIANWPNNRPVYFPPGTYKITNTLTLTQVYRGLIFGSCNALLSWGSSTPGLPMIATNGFQECRMERLHFAGGLPNISGSGAIGIELDWNGTGSVGLQDNVFLSVHTDFCVIGKRIANSGHGGSGNNFFNSGGDNGANGGTITQIVGAGATDNVLWASSGGSDANIFVQADGGSFIAHGNSTSAAATASYVVNTATPCTIAAERTENNDTFLQIGSGATVRCSAVLAIGHTEAITIALGGTGIFDVSNVGPINGNGSVRLRGNKNGTVAGTITTLENI